MTLKIKNWDKWQSYRKDRGQPPWIKIHRALLRNIEWVSLSDSERGQLVSIWLLAADKDGEISDDPELLKKLCFMSKAPNLNKFIELSFMEPSDASLTPERRQSDAPEKNRDRNRIETETDSQSTPHVDDDSLTVNKVVELYHSKLPELPQAIKITPTRKSQINQRIRQDFTSLDSWDKYFGYVRESKFLMGQVPPTNGRKQFIADLDFLIKESNAVKICEGKYDG